LNKAVSGSCHVNTTNLQSGMDGVHKSKNMTSNIAVIENKTPAAVSGLPPAATGSKPWFILDNWAASNKRKLVTLLYEHHHPRRYFFVLNFDVASLETCFDINSVFSHVWLFRTGLKFEKGFGALLFWHAPEN
jgi:hypothetical protein